MWEMRVGMRATVGGQAGRSGQAGGSRLEEQGSLDALFSCVDAEICSDRSEEAVGQWWVEQSRAECAS